MLLEFVAQNVYSYKEEIYFSMEAVKRTALKNEFTHIREHRILKSAIIFGANASGKSNVLNAINTLKQLIVKPDNASLPFPSYAGNKSEPISFQITLRKDDRGYKYSVAYLKTKITYEKLEIESRNKWETYFERNEKEYVSYPKEFEIFKTKTRQDNLFLNTLKTFDDEPSLAVYRWFVRDLLILGAQWGMDQEAFKRLNDNKSKEKVLNFVRAADINIEDIEVFEQQIKIPDEIRSLFEGVNSQLNLKVPETETRLRISHKQYDEEGKRLDNFVLDFTQESLGTQKLLSLALIILLNTDRVILIDEFDNSLHNELARAMLEVFNCQENSNQFILTSHELSLMDSDFKREQIYFVERNSRGISNIYSAYDFETSANRKDYSYLKRYKAGQFGAIPVVLVDALKESLKKARV